MRCNSKKRLLMPQVLSAFLDAVQFNYKDNPYHNFRHGVTVLHATTMLMMRGGGTEVFSELEVLHADNQAAWCSLTWQIAQVFSLMIAALCHDLGHPGVNNTYLVNSKDRLALTYNDISGSLCYCCESFRVDDPTASA